MRRISFCLLCLFWGFSGVTWADMVIIAHQDVPKNTVSAKELQEMFLGKRFQWSNNSAVHPATVKEAKLHEAFLERYIKKSPSQWITHWKRMVFTGNGTPPEQFVSEQELLEYVTKTSGAIGYIDAELATEDVIILGVQ